MYYVKIDNEIEGLRIASILKQDGVDYWHFDEEAMFNEVGFPCYIVFGDSRFFTTDDKDDFEDDTEEATVEDMVREYFYKIANNLDGDHYVEIATNTKERYEELVDWLYEYGITAYSGEKLRASNWDVYGEDTVIAITNRVITCFGRVGYKRHKYSLDYYFSLIKKEKRRKGANPIWI